ncbi:MAG: hypothetical protein GXO70_03850 [Acidobacteria bacterium]|nr:hypothetical protein [Acidobacteriota bacterium]
MKNVLENLQRYQDLLLRIRQLEHELTTYPESVEKLGQELKQHLIAVARSEEQLAENSGQKDRKEEYLVLCKANLEKFEQDLMEVTNQKEYSAVLKEIDSTKREIHETETVIITLMESTKQLKTECEQLKTSSDQLQVTHDEAISGFRDTNQGKIKEKGKLEKEKRRLEKLIPASHMRRFNQIAARRAGIAVATVTDECCSACNMKIRPQMVNNMQRNPDKMYICDNCQRILVYIEPDGDDS